LLQADKIDGLENKIDTLEKLLSSQNHAGALIQGSDQQHVIGTQEPSSSCHASSSALLQGSSDQPHVIDRQEIDTSLTGRRSLTLWNENGQDEHEDNVFLEGLA
jgi:hypothetical protein